MISKKYFTMIYLTILLSFIFSIESKDSNLVGEIKPNKLKMQFNQKILVGNFSLNVFNYGGSVGKCNLDLSIGENNFNGKIDYNKSMGSNYGIYSFNIKNQDQMISGEVVDNDFDWKTNNKKYDINLIFKNTKLTGYILKDLNVKERKDIFKMDFGDIKITGEIIYKQKGFNTLYFYKFMFNDKYLEGSSTYKGISLQNDIKTNVDEDSLFIFLFFSPILNSFENIINAK